jgi:hypothetical protein
MSVVFVLVLVFILLLDVRAAAGYSLIHLLFYLGLERGGAKYSSATRFDGLLIHVARSIYRSASGTVVASSSGREHGTGNVQMVLLEDARRYIR